MTTKNSNNTKTSSRSLFEAMCSAQNNQEAGAALLIVLLLTLTLTAIGIVAIESTVRSMRGAGNYQLRRQANMASHAAITYVSNRVGQKASVYWQEVSQRESEASFESDQGGYMIIDPKTYQNSGGFASIIPGETGLFASDGAPVSHESQYQLADYRVVLRDPIEGPPAVGNSEFCFKKVLFASQVTYIAEGATCTNSSSCLGGGICNKPDSNPTTLGVCVTWGVPNNAAWAASGMEALIGPISCK